MTENIALTHQKQRAFQPHKLSTPRDFVMPDVIINNKNGTPLVLEIGAGRASMHLVL